MTMKAQAVHVTIERTAEDVYAYASRPDLMPLWASGLASGLEPSGDHWIATGELGRVEVAFTPPNPYGVMDHTVTLETGLKVYNAFRVTPNGDGAEVMFTVLQTPGIDDAAFDRDGAWVRKDLQRLKALLEAGDDGLDA